jgi:hypothetical protein
MSEVNHFISNIGDESRKSDSLALLSLLEEVSGCKPYLSGTIIGFGKYHYKYDSGREGDCAVISFYPRKQNLVIYIMPGFDNYESLLKQLGKHKLGKSCLYINKLSDVKLEVLTAIVKLSVGDMRQKYTCTYT